jgi:hypothetical protein
MVEAFPRKDAPRMTTLKMTICPAVGLVLFCWIGHPLAAEALLFDLTQVADRPATSVEKVLGKPSIQLDDVFRGRRGYSYPATRATYMNGAIEVTYIEDGARYVAIWVQKLSAKYRGYSYPKDGGKLLADLGLDRNTTAEVSDQAVTRWRDLPGIYQIDVFPTAENQIWYVHMLINRIYE